MSDKYDVLKLDNQLCFLLYACSKEVVRKYKPFLDELDITYTQYITLMVLWEHKKLSVKELGAYLYLDSGTLTPLLKTLEKKNLVSRYRSSEDERILYAEITKEGMKLRDKALEIPAKIGNCVKLEADEAVSLYSSLKKLLTQFE